MDRYTARITLYGKSNRERELNRLKQTLNHQLPASLSYKSVFINDRADNLIIDSSSSSRLIKEIKSLPGKSFEVGDYVKWSNAYWLITEADSDDELYVDGRMQQCNWKLSYQRDDGSIAQYWCIDENVTQRNSGENENKTVTLGSSQHMIKVQCNEDTLLLNTPKRIFLDKNITNPTSFKISQNDTTSLNYGKGICCITLIECQENTEKDKLVSLDSGETVWIADYIEPSSLPSSDSNSHIGISCRIDFNGKPRIIIGRNPKSFTAKFTDKDGKELTNIKASWKITAMDNAAPFIHYSEKDNNTVQINADYEESLLGNVIRLDAFDESNHYTSTLYIEIGGGI